MVLYLETYDVTWKQLKQRNMLACFGIVLSLCIVFYSPRSYSFFSEAQAFVQVGDEIKNFEISEGPADTALIEFAKQADLTIVFPYRKVSLKFTNSITGEMSVKKGIDKMLLNTGLVATFEVDGVLTIKRISIQDTEYANRSIIQKVVDLFTEEGKDTVTFGNSVSQIEEIEIRGLRESLNWGIDLKQNSIGVTDSIQAEEMGKFPDDNLAESLQRIAGVSIDHAEGEGQFVTVRGFGPQFNTVQSNGRTLATDNRGREFSFDTIAPELVRAITVQKTFSASQPSGGIGSIINIETARPFASDEFEMGGSIKATLDTNSNKTTPHGTIYASNSNEKLGWLFSVSHQLRKTRINEAQTDAWLLNTNIRENELTTQAPNHFVPRNYDQRVRFETRTRTGATAVVQYRPFDTLELSIDYLQSRFDVKTDSSSLGHWFTASNIEDVKTDSNGTAISFSQKDGHATDFHSRTFDRPSSVSALGINANYEAAPEVLVDIDLSKSSASTRDTAGARNALTLIGYLNRSSYLNIGSQILPEIRDFQSARNDITDALGQVSGVSDYLDPSNGRAHVMLRRGWNVNDTFDQAKVDVTFFNRFGFPLDVQMGVMATKQFKSNERWDNEVNAKHCAFCGYFPDPDIPDSFQSVFDAGDDFLRGISGSSNIIRKWLRHDGAQLFEYLESFADANFDAELRDNSFTVKENVLAAYVEASQAFRYWGADVNLKYGVRYENTDVEVNGFESDLTALTILDQTELGNVSSPGNENRDNSSYHNWLPSLSAKAELNDNIVLRLGLSRSITRPTMTNLSSSLVIDTTRQGGDLRASSGLPTLRPFASDNFDLTAEWYLKDFSYVSASYFNKKVSDFIVETVTQSSINNVTDPSTGDDPNAADVNDQLAIFNITRPTNGETATVSGYEFALQYDFGNGWGIIANTTIVDSNAKLDPSDISQKFALTGLSDSKNALLYYEKDALQFRVSWSHRDAFLQSLVQILGPEPTFVRDYQQIDFSASYQLNNNYSLFIEGINISNESVLKHGRFSNQFLLAQQPGPRYALGIRGKL